MANSPDILKYFYEEPALLEPVTPDRDPDARRRTERPQRGPGADGPSMPIEQLLQTDDYYRGYLAGTCTDGAPDPATDVVGLTTLPDPDAFVAPLMDALGEAWWGRAWTDRAGTRRMAEVDADAAAGLLSSPGNTEALVTAPSALAPERVVAMVGTARRHALQPLRDVLDAGGVAFFPEPAHDGHDWSFFSASPMRDRLKEALRRHPHDGVRRFVLPYQKARSESKFYFETWQLKEPSLPDYIEEV